MISQTKTELYKISRSIIVLIIMVALIMLNIFIASRSTDEEPIYSSGGFVTYFEDFQLDTVKKYVNLENSKAETLSDLFWETHPIQFKYVLHRNLGMLFITMIFASYYIGMEFKSRSFNNSIYIGKSRNTVFLSKALVYYLAAALVSFLSVIVAIQFCASRVYELLPVYYVWRCILMYVLFDLGIMSVPLFFVFLFRNPALSGIASLLYSAIVNIKGPASEGLFSYEPNCLKMLPDIWNQAAPQELITKGIIVPIAFIAVFSALGLISFRKAQLK